MVSSSDVLLGRLLIVDDQQASVRLLERMLQGAGYSCISSTTDPRQVRELHEKNGYDLILLDLRMPGMDGFRVLEALKQVEKDGYLSVLVMTAHPGHKQLALQAGAKDSISKPFQAVEVLTRVYNLLELRLLHLQNNGKAGKTSASTPEPGLRPPPRAPARAAPRSDCRAAHGGKRPRPATGTPLA